MDPYEDRGGATKSVDVELVFAGRAGDAFDEDTALSTIEAAFAASPWFDLTIGALNEGGSLHWGLQFLDTVPRRKKRDRPVFVYFRNRRADMVYVADFTVGLGGGVVFDEGGAAREPPEGA